MCITSPDMVDLLSCPSCCGSLQFSNTHFSCVSCGRSFEVQNGIPSFMPDGLRNDYALIDEQKKITDRARQIGWKKAVLEHLQVHGGYHSSLKYVEEYIVSEARADFKYLLPYNKNCLVVDLGSGWGNISASFAKNVNQVISVDTNITNLEFIKVRAEQDGLNNISFLHSDACSFPFKENSIDVVLMVGVLEWVAWGRSGSPHQLQRLALTKVANALKPGGYLYLAIENRFSFKYLLGMREPHTRLRFVSLLPYFLGNIYSKVIRKKEFREVTYSKAELSNLLIETGFQDIQFYYPVPGYQNFRFISDLNSRTAVKQLVSNLKSFPRFTKSLSFIASLATFVPVGMLQLFWPSFCVVAQKK